MKDQKKIGGITANMRLRFGVVSEATNYALRVTDVTMPGKPTR